MKKTLVFVLTIFLFIGLCACNNAQQPCEHQYNEQTTKQPSCNAAGMKKFTCTSCADAYEEEIPMTEHQYGEWTVTKKPTYNEIGEERSTCGVCGDKKYRDIPMLEPVSVELTKDNFLEYFSIDCAVTKFEKVSGTIYTKNHATVQVTCSLKVDGEISNVNVSLTLSPRGTQWDGKTYDAVSLVVPARTGVAETTQILNVSTMSTSVVKPTGVGFTIVAVSGTITIYG